ncbi:hypothetical protein TRFO_22089 [Tritrichomonas foetus]|uniref:Uncharacterized protein n=1 Tax=Tritrichomonas foetus TaxID=1144522 RepID=A0A1J4KHN8_9EUKA|nr:hypothetical protein TRFO_22089 [Tritrichomonas foetus]|eukprot:OHT09166.1 hypothetical protein TRFO_22089 [Tritrichomonas foetus]
MSFYPNKINRKNFQMNQGNVQCQIIYFPSNTNHSAVDVIKGQPISPVACACSPTHFIILDRDSICHGFGMNKEKQIDQKLPNIVSTFTRLQIIPNQTVREIAADLNFSAFILNNGWIVIHGKFYNTEDGVAIFKDYVAPRGLSARNGYLSFAEKKENVILMNESSDYKYKVKGHSIIKTEIGKGCAFALSSTGILFQLVFGKRATFKPFNINFPILTMFASAYAQNSIIISDFKHKLYFAEKNDQNLSKNNETFQNIGKKSNLLNKDNSLNEIISPITVPIYSQTIHTEIINNVLVRLDGEGNLNVTSPLGRVLPGRRLQLPQFKVSCFSATPQFIIAFAGLDPIMPIRSVPEKYHCCANDQLLISDGDEKYNLLTFDADHSYFNPNNKLHHDKNDSSHKSNKKYKNERNSKNDELLNSNFNEKKKVYDTYDFATSFFVSPSASVIFANNKDRMIYYTYNNKVISPGTDSERSFVFNLIPGDTVETPSGVVATFIGFDDDRVWLKPSKSRCIYSIEDPYQLRVVNRPGHSIIEAIVDGYPSVIDVTPEFCQKFGYSCNDLVWLSRKGIVQFIGLFSNKYVFLDFSDFTLFTSEIMKFELIRTMNPDAPHTRFITTAEGDLIELDICGKGKIFLPSDRVSSEYGDATFLGTDKNGNAYVQSDEMRFQEIAGAKTDIRKLKLIRRIGLSASRQIKLNDKKKIMVSVSIYDRMNGLMAADIIQSDGIKGKVVGVSSDEKLYAKTLDGSRVFEVAFNAKLLYRADILSGENSDFVEVGSPAFEVSMLLPDDIVRINGQKEYIFVGIGRSGLYFVDTKTNETFSTSFSPLVMDDAFQVISRTVYPLRH